MSNTHTHSTASNTQSPDAWRDAWSNDREACRVAALMAESERYANVDDRYSRDDYMSALARCAAVTS